MWLWREESTLCASSNRHLVHFILIRTGKWLRGSLRFDFDLVSAGSQIWKSNEFTNVNINMSEGLTLVSAGLLFLLGFQFEVQGLTLSNCTDFKKRHVVSGQRFTPIGYDSCITCTCVNGKADMCISVLCSPPKDCLSSQLVDDNCCEFMCKNGDLDRPPLFNITNIGTKDAESLNTTNLGLRLVASTVTSFLILALLLFMIHRLRQRRLLLMIRRLNNNQMHTGGCGNHHYAIDEDGSVGYYPDQDHVNFGLYDDPPPPYTFWKPPECYFPQGEAPPPYEAALQGNNFVPGSGSGHMHPSTPGSGLHPTTPGSALGLPLTIPSLSNVPLHANNFQMNDLGQESTGENQHHPVPPHNLNVMCSMSSLSSQSELNEVISNVNTCSANDVMVIRSDAVYEDFPPYSGANMNLHHRESNVSSNRGNKLDDANQAGNSNDAVIPPQDRRRSNSEQECSSNPAQKCRSFSDVMESWQVNSGTSTDIPDELKRHSLQVGNQTKNGYYPDPTTWNGDASESSSSSSPTYEQRTMSPTSSDSSSIDYQFSSCVVRSGATALPRRANSDNQVRQARLVPTILATASGNSGNSPKSNSLDRTLSNIKQKIILKKKSKSKKSTVEDHNRTSADHCSENTASALPTFNIVGVERATESRLPFRCGSNSDASCNSPETEVRNDVDPKGKGCEMRRDLNSVGKMYVRRTPRISYVSDGDIPLQSNHRDSCSFSGGAVGHCNRSRPKSYDFGDLSSATCTISEETTPSTAVTGSGSEERSERTECCCSLSSDRPGSGSLGSVTCSSRASFGSTGSSPSREGPASPSSLCSPYIDDSPTMELGGAASNIPPNVRNPILYHNLLSASNSNSFSHSVPEAVAHSRSGSICSETGERKHRNQGAASCSGASGSSFPGEASGNPQSSNDNWRVRHANIAASPTEIDPSQEIRIAPSSWKDNQESYI